MVGLAASSFRVKLEAARSSKMLVSYHNTTWHHNPEYLKLELVNYYTFICIHFSFVFIIDYRQLIFNK
jgi:hypothetical protein